ncbi:hypothetical protein D4764_0116110 [Takifugu flavidus]|uniref:Uncharacterized protein n=1 Tax=Takifugu flavidus TaxID=433684 RepID=A0A5C6MJN1_9TELE|nr:hypothetical protein D4764_0116110 [Takifugu flavidus]
MGHGTWKLQCFRFQCEGAFLTEPLGGAAVLHTETSDLRVFANPVDRTRALLKCHVTSTDKSVRSVSLTEDGATKANWITVTGPLPSGDGSVILILTAEVPLIHTNIYGCVVQTEDRTITVIKKRATTELQFGTGSGMHRITLCQQGALQQRSHPPFYRLGTELSVRNVELQSVSRPQTTVGISRALAFSYQAPLLWNQLPVQFQLLS